jgi:hypothetical protein
VPRAASLLVALLLVAFAAVPAQAATTYKSYSATFSGSHGTTRLTVYTNRAGSLALSPKTMTAGTWGVAIWRGTCSALSSKIVTLPNLAIGSSRAATRTNAISTTIMSRLKGYKAAIRLTRGSSVVCASITTISVPAAATASTPQTPTTPSNCQSGYSPCLPIVADLDCPDVRALGKAPVRVTGSDPYRLDADDDGIGCE